MSRPWTRLADATDYAFRIHADQVRKVREVPYISHLMSVSALVIEYGGDEDLAIAGLLHDAIEDVGIEQEAIIQERFGDSVARIVRACTDADTFPKPPWQARKEAYIAHLETVDQDVLLVTCADKLHNTRSILSDLRLIGPSVFKLGGFNQTKTLWYYQAVAEVIRRRLENPIASLLHITVEALVVEASAHARTQQISHS